MRIASAYRIVSAPVVLVNANILSVALMEAGRMAIFKAEACTNKQQSLEDRVSLPARLRLLI